ncbi:excalibur calcium-binding domain-containing protein [Paenibacillus agilis]|uniref:excalibur calcium-binding domain-containing protein n=1 Tax=Paenibacillus agilis TaxID=3020863 RepID=UPI001C96718B|nr:excalibur calcium-binding domain-containing protein [Paenibacillus agilis]
MNWVFLSLGVVCLIGTFFFTIASLISAVKRDGRAKKKFKQSVISTLVATLLITVAALLTPPLPKQEEPVVAEKQEKPVTKQDEESDDNDEDTKPKKPAPKPQPKPEPKPEPKEEPKQEFVYYKNCKAAKAAGAAPLYAGDPGYSSKLDRDGDGVACE